jgi:hypothetical protein
MKTAMKEKNAAKLEAVRAVKAAIDKYEKENPGQAINYPKVLKPLVKQRVDSIEQFKTAGSIELVLKEEAELAIINVYLSKFQSNMMTSDEMESTAKKYITDNNLGKSDMGKVMSFFKTNHEGLYDGKELSNIVKTILA